MNFVELVRSARWYLRFCDTRNKAIQEYHKIHEEKDIPENILYFAFVAAEIGDEICQD